jgi:site-specific recombinase XerD
MCSLIEFIIVIVSIVVIKYDLLNLQLSKELEVMNLRYAIMQYNVYLFKERGLKEESVQNIEQHLDLFMNWFYEEKVGCNAITKDVLLDFRDYLSSRLKPSTVNMRMKIINQLIGFMNENGFNKAKVTPVKELMLPVAVGEDIRIATREEIQKLERAIRLEGNRRDLLILFLLFEVGLTRSEILNLTVNDVEKPTEFSDHAIGCQITVKFKNKTRRIPLSQEISFLLERQIETIPADNVYVFYGAKGGPLFQDIINQLLEKYSVIGGLNRIVNPQSIKSAYIRELFDKGLTVKEVSEITGMSKHNFYTVYKKIVNPETRWVNEQMCDELKEDIEDEYALRNLKRLEELDNILKESEK